MLQQGLGVYVPNSEDKICAGQKSIDEVVNSHRIENPSTGSVFKTEESDKTSAFINPLQVTPNIPAAAETMSKVRQLFFSLLIQNSFFILFLEYSSNQYSFPFLLQYSKWRRRTCNNNYHSTSQPKPCSYCTGTSSD